MVTGKDAADAGVWARAIERPVKAKRRARNEGRSGDFMGRETRDECRGKRAAAEGEIAHLIWGIAHPRPTGVIRSTAQAIAPPIVGGGEFELLPKNRAQIFRLEARAQGDFSDGEFGADEQLFHAVELDA